MPRVEIEEINPSLVPQVCAFLEGAIGRGISAAEFSAAFGGRWGAGPAGFAIVAEGRVQGAVATIRSLRTIGGRERACCNLSSLAIAPPFRSYAAALLRRAIADPDVVYTNFTASKQVVGLLQALGFEAVDPRERIAVPFGVARAGAPWTTDAREIAALLARAGHRNVARFVADHDGTRLKWVLIQHRDGPCVVAVQLIRARGVRFAYVLYCSAHGAFRRSLPALRAACRRAWGLRLIAWPDARLGSAGAAATVRRPTPVMFRGDGISATDVDGLYSELTLLPILR